MIVVFKQQAASRIKDQGSSPESHSKRSSFSYLSTRMCLQIFAL